MTYPKPAVVNRHGLANTSQGFDRPYIAIVLHIAGGTLAGADSWFDNPAAKTRVNYMVGWNGEIHEYYDPASNVRGYQHGIVQGNVSARYKALQQQAGPHNPNTWAIGIEHEDRQQGDLARQFREHPAMFEASTDLSAWLCDFFGIPVSTANSMAHAEIDAINRVNCPMPPAGRENMIAAYMERVRQRLQGDDELDAEGLIALVEGMTDDQRNRFYKYSTKAAIIDLVNPPLDAPVPLTEDKWNHYVKDRLDELEDGILAGGPLPDHEHTPGGVAR